MIEDEKKEGAEEWKKNPAHLDGVPDMSALIYLEGPNVLHNLDCRYKKNEIYTSISKVLIAVNPFQDSVDYSGRLISMYRKEASKRKQTLPPHVFAVSQLAYYTLVKYKENQSLIVCGESGSGKTESAKHLMRYLAYTPEDEKRDGISIEQQVLEANPILESYGNAKTCLNWNSSRFGKFTKIVFQSPNQDRIVGSFIETYLLEKSRVVHQDPDERNYHIFYYLTTPGALPAERYAEWKLAPSDQFNYSRQGNVQAVRELSDVKRFKELQGAFTTLSFSADEANEAQQLVAAILHMGNVEFTANKRDFAEVTSPECQAALETAAALFQVPPEGLLKRMVTASLRVAGQNLNKELTVADAVRNRDSVAKTLYLALFEWVVAKINSVLFEADARRSDLKWIGILDVFGFESFEHNSFEQFCINFANERLQQYFNLNIIKSEQDLYAAESILWTPITIPDNQDVIDLIDGKSKGVLKLLDETSRAPKPDGTAFVRNLFTNHRFHARMKKIDRVRNSKTGEQVDMTGFSIHHYAGKVIYDAADFIMKNMDQVQIDNVTLFCSSKGVVTSALLEDDDMKKQKEEKKKADAAAASGPVGGVAGRGKMFEVKAAARPSARGPPPGARGPETAFKSIGFFFSTQLEKLMTTLYQTTPYFVRCVKPNRQKQPNNFDWEYVRPQLECGGIIEALRILKCGYPSRCGYDDIFARYGQIMKPTPPNLNKRDFCEAVLRNAGETLERSEFQLGLSKVFFRPGKQAFLEDLLAGSGELPAETVQKIKVFLLNKRLSRGRGAVRVHIIFKLRIRQKRALAAIFKLFGTMRLVAKAFLRLKQVRNRLAANALQSHVLAHLEQKKAKGLKKASVEIENYYVHNRFRKSIKSVLHERIEKKRELLAAEERARREREEAERKEQEARDAADHAKRAKREAEEKIRAEKERMENELRERERIQRERHEEERRAVERKEREMQEELQRAKEAEQKSRRDAERAAEELQATLAAEKESGARLIQELDEKKLALELREFELAKREEQMQQTLEIKQKETVDQMAALVKKGATFFRHGAKIEEANPVKVHVNDDGILVWVEPDTVNEAGEALKGELNLRSVARIKGGTRALNDDLGKDSTLFLTIEYRVDTSPASKTEILQLQAGSADTRTKWMTALRYCVRNLRDVNTLSRPTGDLARGNILAAMFADTIEELKDKNKKLRTKVDELERDRKAPQPPGGPAIAGAAGAPATTPGGSPGGAAADAKMALMKKEIEDLKRKLAKAQLGGGDKGGPAGAKAKKSPGIEDQKRILVLEEKLQISQDKNQALVDENKRLKEKVQLLEDELSSHRVIPFGDDNAAKLHEEKIRVEWEKKYSEAKEGVEQAESAVQEAESAVKRRQDIIRKAMRALGEKKTQLQNTEQTMTALGISGRDPETLTDPTARRLAELFRAQKREQQDAEAELLKEYAAMTAEAEALNEKNENLAKKTLLKEKHETLAQQLPFRRTESSRPGGAGKAVAAAAGGAGTGKAPDDGCVIS